MNVASYTDWIESRLEGGVRILTIQVERLDPKLYPRKAFAQAISDALEAGDRRFVLNLSKMTYTNHTYGVLQLAFTTGQLLHGTGSRVAVCGLKGHLHRAYLFAQIDRYIPQFRTERQAIAAVTA